MLYRTFVSHGELLQINLMDVYKIQLIENKIAFYFLHECKTIYFSNVFHAQNEFCKITDTLNKIAFLYKKNV